VVIAGDSERDVRVAQRVLTSVGYGVTVVAANKLPVADVEHRVEAALRKRPTEMLVLAQQDTREPLLDLIERFRERYVGLSIVGIASEPLHSSLGTRSPPDVLLRSPIDERELRSAAQRLAPALPELVSNAFS
jgi:hypothetical protein